MKLAWVPREPPLAPCAAAGRGPVARRLLDRLLAEDDDALLGLEGVAGSGVVVVAGDRLPWVEGLLWLGRDPAAPALLLPTTVGPDVPVDWLQGAVLRRCPAGAAPIAVLVDPPSLVPLGGARPLVRARLLAAR